ncbi:MAG: HAD family hydrolase [Clostridia bacterium]|nr:HAD family hydrolase [Clostridia bacterium]
MIKRLIFDVDGTIITGVNFIDSVTVTLSKLGINDENSVKLFLKGIKTYEQLHDNYNITDYTKHMEQAINNKLPDDFAYVFWEELKSAIPPKNDKLISTFSKLSKEYELVLLTNYFAKSQLNRLNNMEIGSFFKECYGEKCIKPNENAYLTACGDKKVQECIMIGDDLYLDIEGAKKQGLHTIFVNSKGVETNSNMGIVVNCVEDISKELITQIEEKDFEC